MALRTRHPRCPLEGFPLLLLAATLLRAQSGVPPEEDASLKFFRDIAETRSFTLGRPVSPVPTPDGSSVLFLRGGPRDPVLRLYELHVKTGKVEELLTPEQVLKGAVEKLSVEERARRERMRMTLRGFTSFDLSRDGGEILLTLSGKLYVVRRSDKRVTALPGEGWIDPGLSPDGRFVAAVRDGEVFVIDVAAAKEQQVTSGGSETLTHGLAEFVAQEEMERFGGYWWSPDSRRIVYEVADVSEVEKHYIANPLEPSAPADLYYYPRAGTANAKVRLGIMARTGGATTWVTWDVEKYPYLARVTWDESGPLTVLVQTRDQREEKLLTVDPLTGETNVLLTESDSAWLNLWGGPQWLDDGSAFLWGTERRGGWQIELRGRRGEIIHELTPVGLNLDSPVDIDRKSGTVIVAGSPDPLESHLYRVSFHGGAPVRLTKESGFHTAVYSRDHSVYVYRFSLADGRWGAQVRRKDGRLLAEIPSVAEQPPFVPQVEFTKVGEGNRFDAAIIRPRTFDPKRTYPVILQVYAGPTANVVTRSPLAYLDDQWTADQGYIVAMLDGRGTPGHGREWERVIKGNLIDVALDDQVAGLKALGEKYPEMDLSRVGVTGWSFGGYFTAMATIRRPDVFRCGVAGAPVVDWEDYDTHYTERYMDLPSANPDGYRKSNVLTYAGELQRPLLLIHGIVDDNVYFEHTLKLIDALFKAGRSYDFMPLLSTHLVPDPVMRLRLQTRIMDFFKAHLSTAAAATP